MISILLAIYNGEKYLKKSIDSILNQTYTDFELLIGFNGTIDNSKNIVASYSDKRIKVFDYGMDSGKSKTLNKLIKESNRDWLAMQDDDDIWLPNKLALQMKLAATEKYNVIGSKILYCNEKDEVIGYPNIRCNHKSIVILSNHGFNQVPNTSAIFKKSEVIQIGGWDETISGIEDFDFWLKLMKNGSVFINIKQKSVLHRIHSNSNFNTNKYNLSNILLKYNTYPIKPFARLLKIVTEKLIIWLYLIQSKIINRYWFYKIKLK